MRDTRTGGSMYYIITAGEGRIRRPRDLVAAFVGLLLVWWAITAADSIPDWTKTLADLVASSPHWVQVLLGIGYLASLFYALVITIGLVLGRRERRGATRDVVIVIMGTLILVVVISLVVNGSWPYILPEVDLENPVPRFPVMRVAVVTGILLVVSPYVTRPLRRFGWLAMLTTAIASVALSYGSPIHAVGSFGVGLFTAGLLLAIVGTPRGYPSPESVSYGLKELGVPNRNIRQAAGQDWGLVRFEAEDAEGNSVDIKVHGETRLIPKSQPRPGGL